MFFEKEAYLSSWKDLSEFTYRYPESSVIFTGMAFFIMAFTYTFLSGSSSDLKIFASLGALGLSLVVIGAGYYTWRDLHRAVNIKITNKKEEERSKLRTDDTDSPEAEDVVNYKSLRK